MVDTDIVDHFDLILTSHFRPDLQQWLCVDKLKVCCAADHYGPDCRACDTLGDNGKVCSGKCKGAGRVHWRHMLPVQ